MKDYSIDSQIDMLSGNRCESILSEKVSSRKFQRTELDKCLDYMRQGDALIITKLD